MFTRGRRRCYFPYPGVKFRYSAQQELGSLDFVKSPWRKSFPQNNCSQALYGNIECRNMEAADLFSHAFNRISDESIRNCG